MIIGSEIRIGLRNTNWLRNQNWLRNRSLFFHLHEKRRLDPIMLHIGCSKESKFICKRFILMEIPGLISLLKLLIVIQELLIAEIIAILGYILILLPEQIFIPRSIPILEPILIT